MTASGTFGYGTEYSQVFDIQRLGAIICKGTTLEPREGNPQPRLFETASGLLNSIGWQNIGVKALIKEQAPVWAGWRVPVIVNIGGDTVDDYAQLAKELDGIAGISGIEVNISCPNVKVGGAAFGVNPDSAAEVTKAVKAATSLPVIVKLTPNTADIAGVAAAVAEAVRLLAPGGRLLIVDFAPHGHEFLREEHQHRRLGFTDEEIARWLEAVGVAQDASLALPPAAPGGLTVKIWTASRPKLHIRNAA